MVCCFCLINRATAGTAVCRKLFCELLAIWCIGPIGQDQELVNGMQYYNKHPRSLGHPYLLEGLVHQGSVTIRGKLYSDIWLKYDIHAQQVEVEYRTMNGAREPW